MASGVRVMEKPLQLQHPNQQQQQPPPPPHEALKCPRCDSSNTKFCYYNNYSLSQPRHFCKACKRYWTRGGTLRNVPVGGGCRKNKRVKRPITTNPTTHHINTNSNPNPNPNPSPNPNLVQNQVPPSTTSNGNSNHHLNPLFYGYNFPRFDAKVSNVNETLVSGYDLHQPHMNGNGLGFLPHGHNSNLTFSSFNSALYSTSSSTSAPTMASLLASSLHQQQRFMGFANYDDGSVVKDLKLEETQNRMDQWNNNHFHGHNKNDQMDPVVSSDPNSLLWDTAGGGVWLDPTNNIGSSVPSLI